MCQATVYLEDKQIMQDVIGIEVTEEGVRLTTFFEEPKLVRGRIRSIDLLKHRVLLEPLTEVEDGRRG